MTNVTENNDKRNVSTDALETLGKIIDANQGRDAIHLAVEPIEAAEDLRPGQHIGIIDGKASTDAAKKLGIVDPFINGPVLKGEFFWLIVYPRQITSLRHVWSHPDFAEDVVIVNPVANASASQVWMRKWASEHMSEDYYGDEGKLSDETAYSYAIQAGENNSVGPYEDARDYIDSEWWDHWETITGKRGDRDSYFSCGC